MRFWRRVPFLDPQSGDHKIIWELNRHQHLLALGRAAWLTGDDRCRGAFETQLESWMRANPPLQGINWASMLELAFRSISWVWALHFFATPDAPLERASTVDLLLGLDRQLDHVAQHLSTYFSPNTHLLGEGLALYVAGRVLPELRSSSRWSRIGRTVLIKEATAQVNSDGGHAELSTHYHRYALDFYLLALAVARKTGDPASETFAEVVSRLATFCRTVADDSGRLPNIGDDDGGLLFPICGRNPVDVTDSLGLAACHLGRPDLAIGEPPEEVTWMLGGQRLPLPGPWTRPPRSLPSSAARSVSAPGSVLLSETGYVVLRSRDGHGIMDVGRHGFLNGGHAHADALALVLSLYGRPLLIDPGTCTYTMDRERRDRFRSTAMHNTVSIDGRPQSSPAGPFHWTTRAEAHPDVWRSTAAFDFVEASHNGYLPLLHRRAVLRRAGLWIVADHILGDGTHRADAHWHFSKEWTPERSDPAGVELTHCDAAWAAMVSTASERHEFHGDADGLGWCAPLYGQLLPSLTVRFSQTGTGPFSVVTAITGAAVPCRLSIEPLHVALESADHWQRAAAVITRGDSLSLVLFATPPTEAAAGRPSVQRLTQPLGDLTTDARVAVLDISRAGLPRTMTLIDATEASWTGPGAFSVGPLSGAQDLHLDVAALEQLSRGIEARPAG